MAVVEITVNTDTLSRDIVTLNAVLQNARSRLQSMQEHVNELNTMWRGTANDAFKVQFQTDYENAMELCKTVESIIHCMEYARDQYDICENKVNGIVSAIHV